MTAHQSFFGQTLHDLLCNEGVRLVAQLLDELMC
jgi:hypothetical protein